MATKLFVFHRLNSAQQSTIKAVNDLNLIFYCSRSSLSFCAADLCHPAWGTTQCDCCSRGKVQTNSITIQMNRVLCHLGNYTPTHIHTLYFEVSSRSVVRGQSVPWDPTWGGQKYRTKSSGRSSPVKHLSQRLWRLQQLRGGYSGWWHDYHVSRLHLFCLWRCTGDKMKAWCVHFLLFHEERKACASDAVVILMLSSR